MFYCLISPIVTLNDGTVLFFLCYSVFYFFIGTLCLSEVRSHICISFLSLLCSLCWIATVYQQTRVWSLYLSCMNPLYADIQLWMQVLYSTRQPMSVKDPWNLLVVLCSFQGLTIFVISSSGQVSLCYFSYLIPFWLVNCLFIIRF